MTVVKASRKASGVVQIETRKEAMDTLATYAKHEAQLQKLQAKIDADIQRINDKYKDQLEEHQQHMTACKALLQEYTESTSEEVIELPNGEIGFKKSPPSVQLTEAAKKKNDYSDDKAWKWALGQLSKLLPQYLRQKPEIDKRGILSNADSEDLHGRLEKCGLEVSRPLKFYIKVS